MTYSCTATVKYQEGKGSFLGETNPQRSALYLFTVPSLKTPKFGKDCWLMPAFSPKHAMFPEEKGRGGEKVFVSPPNRPLHYAACM